MKGIVLFFTLGLASFVNATEVCQKEISLKQLGWVIHEESEFTEVYSRLETRRMEPDMIDDLDLDFDSDTLEKTVHFRSWDSLTTYDLEMYGDLVYYSDLETKKVFEIRWYESGTKHMVRQGIKCTCDDIPLAENALF